MTLKSTPENIDAYYARQRNDVDCPTRPVWFGQKFRCKTREKYMEKSNSTCGTGLSASHCPTKAMIGDFCLIEKESLKAIFNQIWNNSKEVK